MATLRTGQEKKYFFFLPLTSKCDLYPGATDLDLARDTSSHDGQYFCQIILKSIKEWQSYGPDMKKDPIFFTFDLWDLDLGATDLGIARDASSHEGQHFCQVILKSIITKLWTIHIHTDTDTHIIHTYGQGKHYLPLHILRMAWKSSQTDKFDHSVPWEVWSGLHCLTFRHRSRQICITVD